MNELLLEAETNFSLGRTDCISLYIHIPFCKTKCGYCDFNTYQGIENLIPGFVDAVCIDIQNWLTTLSNPSISTVFFGGGTPSLLNKTQVEQILNTIKASGNLIPETEITLESNPDDLTLQKCSELYTTGINRLSIGIQALQNNLLTILNRRHSNTQAIQAIINGHAAGFKNISGDLMYGLPSQTTGDWETTVTELVKANPSHISMYSLTIEQGTPFHKMFTQGSIQLPSDDEIADMYAWAQTFLEQKTYNQYEISNWSQKTQESQHNLAYWKRDPYIGIGPGAHSNLGNVRYWNIKSPSQYMQKLMNPTNSQSIESLIVNNPIIEDYEILTTRQMASELMFLGLRLAEGIDCSKYIQSYGFDLKTIFSKELHKLEQEGLLEITGNIIKLPKDKIFIANRIFEEFI